MKSSLPACAGSRPRVLNPIPASRERDYARALRTPSHSETLLRSIGSAAGLSVSDLRDDIGNDLIEFAALLKLRRNLRRKMERVRVDIAQLDGQSLQVSVATVEVKGNLTDLLAGLKGTWAGNPAEDQQARAKSIIAGVAEKYRVTADLLLSHKFKFKLGPARQELFYRLYRGTYLEWPDIGRLCCRDRTSAMFGAGKYAALLKANNHEGTNDAR